MAAARKTNPTAVPSSLVDPFYWSQITSGRTRPAE
jgi:hypothetical protein